MKKLFLISAILVTQLHSFAVIDTLRHANYNKAKVKLGYAFVGFTTQYAVFDAPASGSIQSIILTLDGVKGASVTVHLYGDEGGNPFPPFQKDLTDSMIFKKTMAGVERVKVDLPKPVRIDKNLFFLKMVNFTSSVRLIIDTTTIAPYCSSASGGIYRQGYVFNATAGYYADNAFAIDVIMDYPDGTISPQYLKDITAKAGIATNLGNSTVSWADINNDNFMDLFVGGKLYKNMGDGTFTDITTNAGINTPAYVTTFIDINNDGKEDILFLHPDSNYNAIYINNGNETFTKQPLHLPTSNFRAGVQALAVADFNNDGYPDFFAGQVWTSVTLKDSAQTYAEEYLPHHLYMNDKNLGFIDKTSLITPSSINQYALVMQFGGGAAQDSTIKYGKLIGTNRCVRGAQWVDYNDDGLMDLYVSNYRLQPDELWRNNGDGTFTDVCMAKEIDVNSKGGSGHGTGVDWADFDNDGDMDLLLPQLAHPQNTQMYDHRPTTLYENSGAPSYDFTDLNPGVNVGNVGIEYEETHAGTTWGDLNNDGLQDFAICAFYGCRYSDVYIQKPDHTFEMKSFAYGIQNVSSDADMTLVDYDNDGKLDFAGGSNAGQFTLFKNQSDFHYNYVELNLVNISGNKAAIGAKVTVYTGGEKHTAYQMPYHGAKMSKGNRMHFGLGAALKVDSVVIRWPNGTTKSEKFTGVAINNLNTLTEGGKIKVDTFQTKIWNVVGVKEENNFVSNLIVYPNPATSTVTFDYELATNTVVTLDIYSILGQKISILNNEHQSVGKHVAQWNIKGQAASGIYSYRLQAGDLQKTGLLIIE